MDLPTLTGQLDDVRFYGAELNCHFNYQLYGNGNGDFQPISKAAGTVTITANQPGNNSYAPAPLYNAAPLTNRIRRFRLRRFQINLWVTSTSPPLPWPVQAYR